MPSNVKPKGDPELAKRLELAYEYASEDNAESPISGYSMRMVAEYFEVSKTLVYKWFKFGYMSKDIMPRYCEVCGVSLNWVLTGEGSMLQPPQDDEALSFGQLRSIVKRELSREQQWTLVRDLLDAIQSDRRLIAEKQLIGKK